MFKRRIRNRFANISYYSRPVPRKKKRFLLLIFTLLFLLFIVVFTIVKMHPLLLQMATAAAGDEVMIIVNEAVREKMANGEMNYEDIITLEKDSSGNVTALVTNTAKISILQSEITNTIIQKLGESDTTLVMIPLGNLFGNAFLSGRGPDIPIKVISLTGVSSSFSNEFSAAGINQTRHVIMLNVELVLEVLIPSKIETIPMSLEISVAETVIVGDVPNTYADLNSLGEL